MVVYNIQDFFFTSCLVLLLSKLIGGALSSDPKMLLPQISVSNIINFTIRVKIFILLNLHSRNGETVIIS